MSNEESPRVHFELYKDAHWEAECEQHRLRVSQQSQRYQQTQEFRSYWDEDAEEFVWEPKPEFLRRGFENDPTWVYGPTVNKPDSRFPQAPPVYPPQPYYVPIQRGDQTPSTLTDTTIEVMYRPLTRSYIDQCTGRIVTETVPRVVHWDVTCDLHTRGFEPSRCRKSEHFAPAKTTIVGLEVSPQERFTRVLRTKLAHESNRSIFN